MLARRYVSMYTYVSTHYACMYVHIHAVNVRTTKPFRELTLLAGTVEVPGSNHGRYTCCLRSTVSPALAYS